MGLGTLWTIDRILIRFNPYFQKIQEQLSMSKNVHAVIQALMTAIQGLNAVTALIPLKYRIWIAIGVSGIQGIIGVLNHFDPSSTDTSNSGS